MKTKKPKKRAKSRSKAVAVRRPNPVMELAQQMATMVQSLDSRIASMGEAIGRFDQYREQINQRLLDIVDGKQLVLDPVLSQRLQTMANTLQAPTYVIEGRFPDGKFRMLSILSVGAFAGTVKIQVLMDNNEPVAAPLDPVQATGAGTPRPYDPKTDEGDDIDPMLR